MVAFYNKADQELYKDYQYLPQEQYRLGLNLPTNTNTQAEAVNTAFGIPATNAFTGSGYGGNLTGGNAFGYGSAVNPVALGSYDDPSYFGGLPGNVQQSGIPRNFMYDMDPNYEGDDFMTAYQMTTGKNKELPGFANFALSFLPGGNFLRGKIEQGLNDPRLGQPNYRIGGMDNIQKGQYNMLAGQGMLFDGPGGVKTLTGKNFAGKGYLEGQIDIYNKEFTKSDGTMMTEEEITDLIAKTKADPRKQFKYKQMLEASAMYKTNKAQEKFAAEQKAKQEAAALQAFEDQKARSGITSGANDGRYENIDNRDRGGQGAFAEDKTSMRSAGRSYRDAQGNVGYSRGRKDGGRIGYKHGGLASIL
jgi:hypothetical protein|tara:strand:- start:24 stop:1109 length:1086 start_codon:yes stop_codon:yes gene_type:complete